MGFDWVKGKISLIEEWAKKLSKKAKIILVAALLVMVVTAAVVAYVMYDYTQNNPKFCVTCHLMQPAFDTWALSEHKSLNCHDCHHLSIIEQNMLLVNFVVKRPNSVPERHGHVIVSSKFCKECHINGSKKRGEAKLIKDSAFHMKHMEKQLECSQCHGEVGANNQGVHRFLPTEKFCLKCHEGKTAHGNMDKLACLNCHTDRTKDTRPGRKKCLYCHGTNSEAIRKELIEDATMDVRYFQPDQTTIKKARKITYDETAPMQINCYECHKPHTQGKVRPQVDACLKCHGDIKKVGKHEVHLGMDMKCIDCHKPHVWKVSEASAKKDCVKCHEYRSPKAFK